MGHGLSGAADLTGWPGNDLTLCPGIALQGLAAAGMYGRVVFWGLYQA